MSKHMSTSRNNTTYASIKPAFTLAACAALVFASLYATEASAGKPDPELEPSTIRLVTPPIWAAPMDAAGQASVFHCSSANVGDDFVDVLVQVYREGGSPSQVITHALGPGDAMSFNPLTVPATTYACSFIIPADAVDDIRVNACLSRGNDSDCILMVEPR